MTLQISLRILSVIPKKYNQNFFIKFLQGFLNGFFGDPYLDFQLNHSINSLVNQSFFRDCSRNSYQQDYFRFSSRVLFKHSSINYFLDYSKTCFREFFVFFFSQNTSRDYFRVSSINYFQDSRSFLFLHDFPGISPRIPTRTLFFKDFFKLLPGFPKRFLIRFF